MKRPQLPSLIMIRVVEESLVTSVSIMKHGDCGQINVQTVNDTLSRQQRITLMEAQTSDA